MNDNFVPFDDECYEVKCAVCDNMCNMHGECDDCIYREQKQEESKNQLVKLGK